MGPMEEAVRQAIAAVPALAAAPDTGAVELATTYATAIDDGAGPLEKLGPALLSALDSLGLTPRARGAKGGSGDDQESPLDELRARRTARQHDAATGDTSTR